MFIICFFVLWLSPTLKFNCKVTRFLLILQVLPPAFIVGRYYKYTIFFKNFQSLKF